MPRPKKIKSPEDLGKEFEKLKKPRKPKEMNKKEMAEKIEELNADRAVANIVCHDTNVPAPLEELRKLEMELRACTTETPRNIKYEFFGNEVVLHLAYNNIEVDASIPTTSRYYRLKTAKSYLATAQKMHEVLEEWRGK